MAEIRRQGTEHAIAPPPLPAPQPPLPLVDTSSLVVSLATIDWLCRDGRIPYVLPLVSSSSSEDAIRKFASQQGVAPGIVVGRLQHDKFLKFNEHYGLKEPLAWN